MRMVADHFATDIGQDIKVLQSRGLYAVYVDRGDCLKRGLRICANMSTIDGVLVPTLVPTLEVLLAREDNRSSPDVVGNLVLVRH